MWLALRSGMDADGRIREVPPRSERTGDAGHAPQSAPGPAVDLAEAAERDELCEAPLPDLAGRVAAEGSVAALRMRREPGEGDFVAASWMDLAAHRYTLADARRVTLVYFLKGETVRLESPEPGVTGGGGSMLVIAPGHAVSWSCAGLMKYLHVCLPPPPAFDGADGPVMLRRSSDDHVLRRLGLALADWLNRDDELDATEAWAWSTVLGSHLARSYGNSRRSPSGPASGSADARVHATLKFIEDNLHKPLGVPELAWHAGMSRVKFTRAFKSFVGLSPHRFVLERRVAKARRLLSSTQRSLTEIAYAAGFSSQSHMTSTFRRYVGTTPRAYRERSRSLPSTARPLSDG